MKETDLTSQLLCPVTPTLARVHPRPSFQCLPMPGSLYPLLFLLKTEFPAVQDAEMALTQQPHPHPRGSYGYVTAVAGIQIHCLGIIMTRSWLLDPPHR